MATEKRDRRQGDVAGQVPLRRESCGTSKIELFVNGSCGRGCTCKACRMSMRLAHELPKAGFQRQKPRLCPIFSGFYAIHEMACHSDKSRLKLQSSRCFPYERLTLIDQHIIVSENAELVRGDFGQIDSCGARRQFERLNRAACCR